MTTMMTNRRRFAIGGISLILAGVSSTGSLRARKPTLLEAPLELAGNWAPAPPDAVMRVVLRVRQVCLGGLNLRSDQQPEKLRVDNRAGGNPAVWLHAEEPRTAWVIVDI